MELKEGMYVRTKKGKIGKIVDINLGQEQERYILDSSNVYIYDKEDIIKTSNNIIDLIEVGDYVNGFKVIGFWNDDGDYYLGIVVPDDDWADILPLSKLTIYSIVTKEQFSSMEYRLGE